MKRLLSIILTITLCLTIFTSCGSQSEDLPQESKTTTAATTSAVTTASTTEQTACETSEIDKDAIYSAFTLYSYKTAEEIQAEYPDKTVLVWVGFALTADSSLEIEISIDEINEYLDSIGKEYVLCYYPLNMTAATVKYDNGEYDSMLDCFTDYLESGGQPLSDWLCPLHNKSWQEDLLPTQPHYGDNSCRRREPGCKPSIAVIRMVQQLSSIATIPEPLTVLSYMIRPVLKKLT